jgi:hypothetical protein
MTSDDRVPNPETPPLAPEAEIQPAQPTTAFAYRGPKSKMRNPAFQGLSRVFKGYQELIS